MDTKEMANRNLILKIRSGSQLYGTVIDGKSDADYIGVCVPDKEFVLGTYDFEQYQERSNPTDSGKRNTSEDYDMTIYSLPKFVHLLENANPTILEVLFAPKNCVLVCDEFGRKLIENRNLFLSLKIKHTYCGYAYSQRMKMMLTENKTGHRVEDMKKYGYDPKFASHTIRLLHFGIELLKEGTLTLPTYINHKLIDIKQGKYGLDDVLGMYEQLNGQIETAYLGSALPRAVDKKAISYFQQNMLESFWRARPKAWTVAGV